MSRSNSPLENRLIFVVGARRSGTNWLQRVIGAHPDVLPLPSETSLFSLGLAPLAERFHHGPSSSGVPGITYMDRQLMLDALRDLCDSIFTGIREGVGSEAPRILERTPDHVRHLELMGSVYPDGWFLHIVRDGRDVARSLMSQPWGPDTVEKAADEWVTAIESARRAAPEIARYREVRYEDLLEDPPLRTRELFEWLGLEQSEETIEAVLSELEARFNVDQAAPRVASGKWRQGLSSSDLERFELLAGTTLESLGYAVSDKAGSGAMGEEEPARLERRSRRRWRPPVPIRRRRRPAVLTRQLLRDTNYLTHQLVDLLGSKRWGDVAALVKEDLHVSLVAETSWTGRGVQGLQRLTQTLADDPALDGRQIRGDVFPSVPTTFTVLAFLTPDGITHHRLVATTAEAGKISRIAYYRLAEPGSRT